MFEDEFDEIKFKIKSSKSVIRKQAILNKNINKQLFYYNPIYKDLLEKKRLLTKMKETEDLAQYKGSMSPSTFGQMIAENTIVYKKKRKQQKVRRL
jgi:hypothetical protein